MLHILTEDGNSQLKNRFFPLGVNLRKHLQRTLNNYNGDKDVDGYKRLVNILSMENGIAYNEMKRIKNFFDNFKGSPNSIEFILNGGQPMMLWVNATLNRATQAVKDFKTAKKEAGIDHAFIRPHEKNRQTKTSKPTTAKIQVKNAAKDVDSNNAIKYENKSHKKSVITESQESKSISAAKKLVIDKMGWDEQRADKFVREELRGDIPVLRTKNGGKFILGVTRMFLDRQLTDGGIIQRLNATLEFVASDAHINEYDRNLNGMSAQELIDRFSDARKEKNDKDREEVSALELQENNDYTIVQIDNFEQSSQYGKYTSWCVTYESNMLAHYTTGGIGQFYFCLKNGFENVPAEPGENCPLDEYGLSMVAVCVDGDGNLAYCTCRWNHANGGNDHIMDTKQISQLIGRNFYEVFKPNNKWQTALDDAMQRLANGEQPEKIFDECRIIENNLLRVAFFKKYNIIKIPDKQLLFDKWLKSIGNFENGFAAVQLGTKCNYIDVNGKVISPNQWFDNVNGFNSHNCGIVYLNEKTNLIKEDGTFVLKEWVDEIIYNNRYAEKDYSFCIKLNQKYNLCNFEGKILFKEWFDEIHPLTEGFWEVNKDNKRNCVNNEGKLISPDLWFDGVSNFEHGYSIVSLKTGSHVFPNKHNVINNEGELLSPDQWFDEVRIETSEIYRVSKEVEKNGFRTRIHNFINKEGKLISPDLWFDNYRRFKGGWTVVMKDRKENALSEKGELISPNLWFDSIILERPFYENVKNGYAVVEKDRKYNFIKRDGTFISQIWSDTYIIPTEGFFIISHNGKYNYIDYEGNTLLHEWVESAWSFSYGTAVIGRRKPPHGIEYEFNLINTSGEILFPEQWLTKIGDASEYIRVIRLGNKFNYFNCQTEKIISTEWFDGAYIFSKGLAIVFKGKKCNLLKKDGTIVSPEWSNYNLQPYYDRYKGWRIYIPSESKYKNVNFDGKIVESVKTKRTITITEEQYRQLLSESQESKSISAAKKLVMQEFGWDEQRADKFVREELRGDLPVLRTRNGGKFILGVTRMFLDRQLTDGGVIQQLNSTLELVASDAHINEYDRNLNDMSAQELIDRFASARKEMGDKDREENAALELQENNDYTIVRIDNFEQSSQYGQYTSWCVTHSENMLDSYTSGGVGQFYFCLKNGFENVPEKRGEGCPLDEYGLSMVAVSVDEDGRLNTSTCRWNHDCGGNDKIMTTKQISQLIGRNFYEVFKPNNKWKNMIETAMQRLANGERPQEIFENTYSSGNGFIIVHMLKKRNVCVYDESGKKYRLLSPDLWFDEIYYVEQNKIFEVCKNRKWNWLKEDGTLLSPNQWFDNITDFVENSLAFVTLNNKFNLFTINGDILCDNWYDDISSYSDNLARVNINQNCGFINKNGKLAFNKWFLSATNFKNGFAIVIVDNGYNIIDTNGNFVSKQCFDFCDEMTEGFARVRVKDKWNYIDANGNMLSKQWFDFAGNFKEGLGHVQYNEKENFIKTDGSLISDRWYKSMSTFSEGFSVVEERASNIAPNMYNYIDTNGKLLSETWFDWCSDFKGGLSFVQKFFEDQHGTLKNCIKTDGTLVSPNKWFTFIEWYNLKYLKVKNYVNHKWIENLLDIETGEILCNEWFDGIYLIRNGFAKVMKEPLGYNFINTDGNIISDEWFYDAGYFDNGFARVWRRNYDSNYINTNGEMLSPNLWFDETYDFDENGFGVVRYNNRYNLIDGNGKLVSDQGFSHISRSGDLYVGSSLDGKPVIFNPEDNTISPMKMKNRFETKQRKNIIITEAQAFDLLLEAASLADVYQKYYNQIPEDEFREIVAADPTAKEDKMGKYSKWLLALYTGGNLKLEDLYKATEYLTTFHRYKAKLDRKDIGQYKSLPDLYDAIEPYADNTKAASHKEEIRQIKQNAKKVYEDNEWLVIVPLTKEAAIEYGKGTQWCTAATTSNNMFNYYNSEGNLYININKKTGRKYQFHFQTRQFMDENDRHIDIEKDFKPTEGLYKFYFNKYGWRALYLRYGSVYVGYPDDAPVLVIKNGQSNYVNQNGDLISETWYGRGCDVFNYGLAKVELFNAYNYIDINGNLLSPNQWFDFAESFYDGNEQARIELKRKKNLINRDGQIVSPDLWFDWCSDSVMYPAALVKIDGKGYNYVTPDGQILCKQWFDAAYSFESPDNITCAEVINNNKRNFINEKGELISPHMWFDELWDFYKGYAKVNVGQSYNLMDAEGNLFSPNMWFSSIDRYKDNMAIIVMYDENSGRYLKNFFNAETKRIISDEWFVDVSDFWSSPDNQHSYVVRQNGQKAIINKDGEIVQNFFS